MIVFADMIDDPREQFKFDLIHHTYRNIMYRAANNILRNSHDAEDAVQQSMIKVIHILHRIDYEDIPKAKSRKLMCIIAKYTAIDIYRKRLRLPQPAESIELSVVSDSPEEVYLEIWDYQNLISCIGRLKESCREVLQLRVLYHLSAKEAGEILNISEENVNIRFMRAKLALKELLKENPHLHPK